MTATDVTIRGTVPRPLAQEAAERVEALQRLTRRPLLHARVVLTQERNPRIERPARAEGELLFAGRPLRARATAPTMRAAVDELVERLQEQLRRDVDRTTASRRVPPATACSARPSSATA